MDLDAKLEGARRNVAALREALAQKQAEAANVNTLLVKWIGVAEYLESVIRDETAAEAAAPADGGPVEAPAESNGHSDARRLEALPVGRQEGA